MKQKHLKIILAGIIMCMIAIAIMLSKGRISSVLGDKGNIYHNKERIVASGDSYSYINQQGTVTEDSLDCAYTYVGYIEIS